MSQTQEHFPKARLMRKIRRFLKLFGMMMLGVTLGALSLAFVLAGDIYEYQDTVDGVHLPDVDAIVCLAGGRGRIAAAGDIWYRYWDLSQYIVEGAGPNPTPEKPPILYISGMGHQAKWSALARQLRRGVLQTIKPENVILETESENTEANAHYLARYAQERKWDKVLLITSSYHMKRSRMIFENVLKSTGKNIGIETYSIFQEPFEPGEWRSGLHGVRVTVTEYLKLIYYKSFWRA